MADRQSNADKAAEATTAKAKATRKQQEKVTKVGGEAEAVNPEAESTRDAAGFQSELQQERIAEGEDGGGFDLHHGEKATGTTKVGGLKDQEGAANVIPASEQRQGTAEPNGDQSALESDEIDSAGEQKASGYAKPSATDRSVVMGPVADQKSVGAIARAEAPAGQDKNAIAEQPVELPNGERVVTYATPPRVAVVAEPETVTKGNQTFVVARQGPVNPAMVPSHALNGVTLGLETVDSGIIPDPTVAETDGTYMPGGAPNETHSGEVAPEGEFTGALLNAAPLNAPKAKARPYQGDGSGPARPNVQDMGLAMTALSSGPIVDEATMQPPNTEDLFRPLYEYGSVLVTTRRLLEVVAGGPFSTPSHKLLLPQGAQVSEVQAAHIVAQIEAANENGREGLRQVAEVKKAHDDAQKQQREQRGE